MASFLFTGTAAAGTSAANGATSGGVTPWFRIADRIAASSFLLTGTFSATISPEYSNVSAFDKGSDFGVDATVYTVPTLRELPLGIADYVRYRCTVFVSGAPKISHARAIGAGNTPLPISEQSTKTPAPSSEAS